MCGNYLIEITIVPFLLTIAAIGLWMAIEWYGTPFHRFVAGGLLGIWIAICAMGIATRFSEAQRSYATWSTKYASSEMLYAAILRMERGDFESLAADFKQMRQELDRSEADRSTIDETFLDFAHGKQ